MIATIVMFVLSFGTSLYVLAAQPAMGVAAAPGGGPAAILGLLVGVMSLVWLVLTARMLHFMRKAIPVA